MKYLKQFTWILFFTFLGEALTWLLPLPIPAAIYGILLLLGALGLGWVRPSQLEDAAGWLLAIMPVLFVAPAVNLIEYWPLVSEQLFPILGVIVISTVVVFFVSGRVTQTMQDLRERKEGKL